MNARKTPSACIVAPAGLELGPDEAAFFRDVRPLGFILFARNIEQPDQVRSLVRGLRETVGDGPVPILIDQEGGRIQRLREPIWRETPPAATIAALFERDPEGGRELARLAGKLIAAQLVSLGISVACAPVLDVLSGDAHGEAIGDRSFGRDPEIVADLARAMAEGLLSEGVLPIMKHIPGHGRARADSHLELPRVEADREALQAVDFAPFRALADLPLAMTAHILYAAYDTGGPATLSSVVVNDAIRNEIGFDGLLISDDLSMKALDGSLAERAQRSIAAGCDVTLHCNGRLEEMMEVAVASGPMSEAAIERYHRAEVMLATAMQHTGDAEAIHAAMRSRLAAV